MRRVGDLHPQGSIKRNVCDVYVYFKSSGIKNKVNEVLTLDKETTLQ